MLGLYVHIPFCRSICSYCDFTKEMARENKKDEYIHALIKELNMYQTKLADVQTIYIGGGTPSSQSIESLTLLLETLTQIVKKHQIKEFNIECNPEDITLEMAMLFNTYGVNRVSLGVQTFNKKHLITLNRKHTPISVAQSIDYLHQVGIDNINVDMIFSIPYQTYEDVIDDINELSLLKIKHISYYSLILEPKTLLFYHYSKGNIQLVDEDLEAMMYETVIDHLNTIGFKQYEVSNFAQTNYQSLHNLNYWQDGDYLGIGCGAHSKIGEQRMANITSVSQYIDRVNKGLATIEQFEVHEGIKDVLLMGLRLTKGVHVPTLEHRFQVKLFDYYPKLITFIRNGLLCHEQEYLRFTRKGLLLGNEVFEIF